MSRKHDSRYINSPKELTMTMGKILIICGVLLIFAGLTYSYFPKMFSWLGNLPGDLKFRFGNFRVYIPFATMLVLSIILTIILKLISLTK